MMHLSLFHQPHRFRAGQERLQALAGVSKTGSHAFSIQQGQKKSL